MTSDLAPRTPVDLILEEQRDLTAVGRFSRLHQPDALPAQEKYYRDLIPLTAPLAGQQYSFEVDLDRCSGCQACVTACHSLNGLDDDEAWREIGILVSESAHAPYQATVTTACHHCVDPACLSGCPVLAYDKNPVTGIVKHLDDQCIGCQYCAMTCPYEVPKYSKRRGIVRKCDMCSSRLEQGEAPACVQACPSQAIRITLVNQADLVEVYRAASPSSFLPASPSPSHTVPTTRYVTAAPLPETLAPGDRARLVTAQAHHPLVFMLVLSQLAAGSSVVAVLAAHPRGFALTAAAAGVAAIGIGTLHLGRPMKAWRSFLGWRSSWFSREVIAFGLFVALATTSAAAFWVPAFPTLRGCLSVSAAVVGVAAVACSAMVYVATGRDYWGARRCFGMFFGTAALLGLELSLVFAAGAPAPSHGIIAALAAATAGITAAKLAYELHIFRHLPEEQAVATQLGRTALLLAGSLGLRSRTRVFLGVTGGIALPSVAALASAAGTHKTPAIALAALGLCCAAEMLERHLFFVAVAPDKMPGTRAA